MLECTPNKDGTDGCGGGGDEAANEAMTSTVSVFGSASLMYASAAIVHVLPLSLLTSNNDLNDSQPALIRSGAKPGAAENAITTLVAPLVAMLVPGVVVLSHFGGLQFNHGAILEKAVCSRPNASRLPASLRVSRFQRLLPRSMNGAFRMR